MPLYPFEHDVVNGSELHSPSFERWLTGQQQCGCDAGVGSMLRGALLVHQVLPHETVWGGQREESPAEKHKTLSYITDLKPRVLPAQWKGNRLEDSQDTMSLILNGYTYTVCHFIWTLFDQ